MIQSSLPAALSKLTSSDLSGALWIVEPRRTRIYDPDKERS